MNPPTCHPGWFTGTANRVLACGASWGWHLSHRLQTLWAIVFPDTVLFSSVAVAAIPPSLLPAQGPQRSFSFLQRRLSGEGAWPSLVPGPQEGLPGFHLSASCPPRASDWPEGHWCLDPGSQPPFVLSSLGALVWECRTPAVCEAAYNGFKLSES